MSTKKRERFIRLVDLRVRKAIKLIRLIGVCFGNKQAYEWLPGEDKKVVDALVHELDVLETKIHGEVPFTILTGETGNVE